VKGKAASRSFSDLQILNSVWNRPSAPKNLRNGTYGAGSSPIERLPIEILGE
jgi:hypothetical protein